MLGSDHRANEIYLHEVKMRLERLQERSRAQKYYIKDAPIVQVGDAFVTELLDVMQQHLTLIGLLRFLGDDLNHLNQERWEIRSAGHLIEEHAE